MRVVRFYLSLLRLFLLLLLLLLLFLLRLLRRRAVSPQAATAMSSVSRQPRSSALSVPCQTSTATLWFSVPCQTSTASLCAQCSLPDLNRDSLRAVFPAGPQPREDMSERMSDRMSVDMSERMSKHMSDRWSERM